MSNQFLKLRRSAVPGKIPETSSLDFGEIALNTYDGLAFMKKLGSNGEEIITIGSTTGNFTGSFSGSFTGSLLGTSSWANNAITSSYALNALSASYALTSSLATRGIGSFTGSFSGSLYNLQGTVSHIPYFSQSQVLADSTMFQVDNGGGAYSIAINQNGVSGFAPEALFVYQPSPTSFNVISGKGNLNNYLQLNIQNENNGANASSDIVATANNGNENYNYIDMGINGANFNGFLGGPNDAYIYATGSNFHIGNINPNTHLGFFVGGDDVMGYNKLQLNPDNQHSMTGSLNISGSLIVLDDITGSLYGTASWAQNSLTSSYILNAISSSFASTASSADNFLVRGTLTAQTIVAQVITASTEFITGSTKFGNIISNTHQFTGSVSISGSLNVTGSGITGSLFGTSSWANNATTASYILNAVSASFATSASQAITASYIRNAVSASVATSSSYAVSASIAQNAITASYVANASSFPYTGSAIITGSLTVTGSISVSGSTGALLSANVDTIVFTGSFSQSGSVIISGSVNVSSGITGSLFGTASWANNATTASYILNAVSASYASSSTSASFASTASFVSSAQTASYVLQAVSASFATQAANANTASYIQTAQTASYWSGSITNVLSASYASSSTSASFAFQATNANTASYVLQAISASFATLAQTANTASYVLNAVSAAYASASTSASFAIQAINAFTASYILNAVSASYANNSTSASYASGSTSASFASTSSFAPLYTLVSVTASMLAPYVLNSQTSSMSVLSASYASGSTSASFATQAANATTASHVLNAVSSSYASGSTSASFALTASSADNFTVRGTLTAQTIVVQTITSSTDFVTGSTRFGSIISNTHQFTGSISVSGSITGTNGVINALTASNASNAITASYALVATSASYASASTSASYASSSTSASFAFQAVNATTASYVVTAQTASFVQSAQTASYILQAESASFATSASQAVTASYIVVAQTASFVQTSQTASYVLNAISTSFATSASQAITASYILNAISASFSSTSSFINTLNQNVLITGSLTIGSSSLGSSENTLIIGTPPNGGAGEGGQILLQASEGLYTSASMLDTYQNKFRILRGTNAGSDAFKLQIDLHSGQVQIPNYTGSGAFTGTVAANLAVDSSGNILTVAPGTVTSASFASTSSYANATATIAYTIGGSQIYYTSVLSSTSPSTANVFTNNTGSFTSAFYNYTLSSGSNARSGQISAVWVGNTVSYNDYSTTDIGYTSLVTASVAIVTGQVQFNFQVPSSTTGWSIKATATYI